MVRYGEFYTREPVDAADTEQEKFDRYERVFEYLTRASNSVVKNIDFEKVKASEHTLTAQTIVEDDDDDEQESSEVTTVNRRKIKAKPMSTHNSS